MRAVIEADQEPGSRFFRAWAEQVLRFRWPLLGLIFLVTAGAGVAALLELRVDPSVEPMIPGESDTGRALADFRAQFGRDDYYLLLVEGDVFTREFLASLRALHDELAVLQVDVDSLGERKLDRDRRRRGETASAAEQAAAAELDAELDDFGEEADAGWEDEDEGSVIEDATSLVNVPRAFVREIVGLDGKPARGLEVRSPLEPWPTSDEDIARVRRQVLADRSLVGRLVSEDGQHTVLALRAAYMNEADLRAVTRAVLEIAFRHSRPGFVVHTGGRPALAESLYNAITKDLIRMGVLAHLMLVVILAFLFRSRWGVLGPVGVVALAVGWTTGVMALADMPLTVLSNVLPALIVCVGVGDSIHIQSVYRDARLRGVPNRQAIIDALGTTAVPVLFTTLTTAAGFLSFLITDVPAIAEMGAAGALGVGFALLHSLVLLPICLSFNHTSLLGARQTSREDPGFIDGLLYRCDDASRGLRRRNLTLAACVLLTGVAAIGISLVRVHHDPMKWVGEEEPMAVAFRKLDRHLGGSSEVQLLVRTDNPSGLRDLELVKRLAALDEHVRSFVHPDTGEKIVGVSTSALNFIRETNHAIHGEYAIPSDPGVLSEHLTLYENADSEALGSMTSKDLMTARIVLRVRWMEAGAYLPLTEHIAEGIERFVGEHAVVKPTGLTYNLFTLVSGLITNLLKSFAIAFGVITLFMIVLLRGPRLGLIAMVPNLLPITFIVGIMGFSDVPIDLGNLVLASVAIGLAVDDTIHFLHHFREHHTIHGRVDAAIDHSFRHAGRAMVGTSLVLALGFLIFLVSGLPSIRRFGLLICGTVVLALLVDIIFAPALLRLVYRDRTAESRK